MKAVSRTLGKMLNSSQMFSSSLKSIVRRPQAYKIKGWHLRSALILAISLLVYGCTSLVGKGDELFKAGNYHEAADLYQQALNEDANNVDAAIGLKRARTNIIDRDLIETRMLRLGSNMQAATAKLESVLRNQNQWNIESQGAVAATQAQELRFAKPWLIDEATRLATSEYPDELVWFSESYQHVTRATKSRTFIDDTLAENKPKGKRRCNELVGFVSGQRHFLADFARRYCAAWGERPNLTVDARDRSRFNRLSIDEDVAFYSGRNTLLRGEINQHIDELKEQFRSNIWYASEAQNALNVELNGEIRYSRTRHRERRQKNYVVTNSVARENAEGKIVSNVQEVKKTHYYYSWVYSESLRVQVQVRSKVADVPVSRSASLSRSNRTEEHAEDFSAAGLYPLAPQFLNIDSLVDTKLSDMISDYFVALNDAWETQYCRNNVGRDDGESALRCAAVDAENENVNRWFVQQFGISYAQMAKIYSL